MTAFAELACALGPLRGGFSPLWNPSLSCGTPLFAQPGLAMGYPGILAALLVPAPWGAGFFLAAHAALAFGGARRWAASLDLDGRSQALVALGSGLLCAALGWRFYPSLAAALAWIPWALALGGAARVAAWALLLSTGEPLAYALALPLALFKYRERALWLAFAVSAAVWLPSIQAAWLSKASDQAMPWLSAPEAALAAGQAREARVFDASLSPTAKSDAPQPSLSWVLGSRRPVAALRALEPALAAPGEGRDRLLGLMGCALALQRKDGALERVRIQAPVRAAFVSSALVRDSDAGLQALGKPYLSRPLLLESPDSKADPSAAGAIWTMLPYQAEASGGAVVSLPTGHPAGWVYVSDAYVPGWEARVDGKPRRIVRAESAFRAVPVEAGESALRFNYRPWFFYLGWLISILGLLFAVFPYVKPGKAVLTKGA